MLELVILATTDLHTNLRAYDYYKDAPVAHYGLARVATLIAEERKSHPTAVLVDAGDFLQGSPLGDVYGPPSNNAPRSAVAKRKISGSKLVSKANPHPVVEAFAKLKYDAVALGNHEFDYGLPFLKKSLASAPVAFTSANVTEGGKPLVKPFVRVLREIGGERVSVCLFGLTPPQTLRWNKEKLAGKLAVEDGFTAAQRTSAALRQNGCHVVVAIVHGGFDPLAEGGGSENPAWQVAGLTDVDAVVGGHVHQEFPSPKFEGLKEADVKSGLVRGKPAVIAGQWGSHLGVITLRLEKKAGMLRVVGGTGALRAAKDVMENKAMVEHAMAAHAATLASVRAPVGRISQPIETYFSRLQSTAAVDLVNEAQTWFVTSAQKNGALAGTPMAKLPVLSAAAPFKAGFKGEFTVIPKGIVAVKNIADLYVYPNTLHAVAINGAQVKAWLERSAQAFMHIKPEETGDRPLLDDAFPSYNFDVFSGVTYEIDVSKPVGSRIVNLREGGAPVEATKSFLIATNNYRAGGGGGFPPLGTETQPWETTHANRDVLFDFFRSRAEVDARPAGGWHLASIEGVRGRVWVDLSDKAAAPASFSRWPDAEASAAGVAPGFVRYTVNLAKPPTVAPEQAR